MAVGDLAGQEGKVSQAVRKKIDQEKDDGSQDVEDYMGLGDTTSFRQLRKARRAVERVPIFDPSMRR